MGKRARNRRRASRAQPWEGIDGRNPLTLAPGSLAPLVTSALEHIVAIGFSSDGRPSLAGCWVMGEQMIAEAGESGAVPPWVGEAHPLVLAYVGAIGDPTVLSLPLEGLTAATDGWAEALDAVGTNDRLRAFTDAVDRLARHDNPHGHALNHALAVELADRPLTLEPLARRLLPTAAVAATAESADAAYPPGPRRIPTASGTHVNLSGKTGELMAAALRDAFDEGTRLGLGADASLGEIMQAQGISPDEAEAEMFSMLDEINPAAAYAWLATDGLILTRDNIRLVDSADAQRWSDACEAYEAVFELADQLVRSDHNDDSLLDTRIEASGIALDELVTSVDDGAMKAWRHLVDRIEQHPAAAQIFEGIDVAAFTDLWGEAEGETETAALEAARRLAVARFDTPVVETLEGVVRQAGGLPDGDMVVHEHAPDRRERLAVWTLLLAGLRAATGDLN